MKKSNKMILLALTYLVIIEIGLQLATHIAFSYTVDLNGHYEHYKGNPWGELYVQEAANIQDKKFEPMLGWVRQEFHGEVINIGADGLRFTWNPVVDNENIPSLYIFGGSTIWGTGARDAFTIPSLISKSLSNYGQDYLVKNMGESGFVISQELNRLISMLRRGARPEFVIFYDGYNDVYSAYQSGIAGQIQNLSEISYRMNTNGSPIISAARNLLDSISKKSMTVKAINRVSELFSSNGSFSETGHFLNNNQLDALADEIVKEYSMSLDLLDKLSSAYGFKYLCFWQPMIFTEESLLKQEQNIDNRRNDTQLALLYQLTHIKLEATKLRNFRIITDSLSGREKPVYLDFGHLNEHGNSLIANKITEHLLINTLNSKVETLITQH